MQETLEKLLKLKAPAKVGVVLAAIAVLAGGYYTMFYAEISDEITRARATQAKLKDEIISYEKRKKEYLAYRNELKQLQEEQRELLRVLPKKDEIPSFMQSLQEQVELSGLEMTNWAVDSEIPDELYVKIPVKMEVKGGYHAVTKFFRNLSELKRIVTVENLTVTPERNKEDDATGATKLRARFLVVTFRYQDPAEGGGT